MIPLFDDDLEIKMILLGDTGVGKTSIISRYIEDKFNNDVVPSISMSYAQKKLTINNQKLQLNIWDTVGQEKLRSLSKLFFTDAQIVILVYAIDNEESFKSLDFWLNQYKQIIGDDVVLGIAGNKNDLYLKQKVEEKEGKEFAEENGGFFSLVSAKDNRISLEEFINKLVVEFLKKNPGLVKTDKKIKLSNNNDSQEELKSGCCDGKKNKRIIRKYGSIINSDKKSIDIAFLGDNSVGKTSIINRINKKEFNDNEIHTEKFNESNYKYNKNKMKLDININDLDNNQKKSKEYKDIIKKSGIFFIVYDVKNKESMKNIEYWLDIIKAQIENINKIIIYILANKNDKNDGINNNSIIEEGKIISKDFNALFKAISAKDDDGIMGIIDESVENYLAIP